MVTPSARAIGEIANCTMWIAPVSDYDTSFSIIHTYHLAMDEFYAMNPSVKNDCSGLARGTNYCISTKA